MKKVLIINDSNFEARILKDMVTMLGYVAEISAENKYLRYLGTFEPDCVIVNYILKETRGTNIVKVIKEYNSSIKCVIQSSDKTLVDELKGKQVDEIFLTPIKLENLENVLKEVTRPLQV